MLDLLPLDREARKRLSERGFPTTLTDPRLGLSDNQVVAELVHRTLSYAVMDPIDRRGKVVVRNVGALLRHYAAVQVDDESAPPFPELAETALASARQTRTLLGIDFDDEHEAWELIKTSKSAEQGTCSVELLSLMRPRRSGAFLSASSLKGARRTSSVWPPS